ncbi:MAG: WbqC family protein [Solobacterium sp.]|nr:WbqC family protein [Solobacterium sp.]
MKIAIMQPYFFPYIGYWQLIHASDVFLILDDVHYIKRGWINRNRILYDGKELFITNPVSHVSQNAMIMELDFVNDSEQIADMEKTIAQAYRNTPYLEQTMELVHAVLWNPHKNIADYLEYQIRVICRYLGIETTILRSSAFRGSKHPTAEAGIIALTKTFHADHYINPIGGLSLYHRAAFEEAGMEISFLQTDFEALRQMSGRNQMDLSIIDLLTHYPPEMIRKMLECFDLIRGN